MPPVIRITLLFNTSAIYTSFGSMWLWLQRCNRQKGEYDSHATKDCHSKNCQDSWRGSGKNHYGERQRDEEMNDRQTDGRQPSRATGTMRVGIMRRVHYIGIVSRSQSELKPRIPRPEIRVIESYDSSISLGQLL